MLAQSFRTAAELEISDERFEALVKTLALLELGDEIEHTYQGFIPFPPKKFLFNMNQWPNKATTAYRQPHCGTAACIGGTAEMLTGVDMIMCRTPGMKDLFYPKRLDTFNWKRITVAQGAQALRNYLTTGDAQWTKVAPDLIDWRDE